MLNLGLRLEHEYFFCEYYNTFQKSNSAMEGLK
ncbi:hypothetical protein BXY82_1010 [Gelidibacter sediminis]|uniref:Uncharacterized protein n=1 Tax=Gelidibacter sediminis TaxID=1608710 RepID=A0A4V6Q4Q3_9FLAO|nr:hypothetical protein BXY82_1010 [Gelidibacter sediminis]